MAAEREQLVSRMKLVARHTASGAAPPVAEAVEAPRKARRALGRLQEEHRLP